MQENHQQMAHNTTTETPSNLGLLSLINQVKDSLQTNINKKIEDLEFQLLEKEEALSQLTLEINALKAQNEAKERENYKLTEEIKAGRQALEQILVSFKA